MNCVKLIFVSLVLCGIATFCRGEQKFTVTSASFSNNSTIPAKYTLLDRDNSISPQLSWKNVPVNTKSFVITCIDANPVARNWVHWMIINIPATVSSLPENASPEKITGSAVELQNSFGATGYGGPKPPAGTGIHNYVFTVYALKVSEIKTDESFLSEKQLLRLIGDKIIGQVSITGKCRR
ncbi:MAG: YbhB/YbcL family Raf kinase inhibitor-like protein [Victivallaceae bacterium]